MIYLSLDIETTGLTPVVNDILEIGIYIEDTQKQLPREQLPCFHKYLWREAYCGHPVALAMNAHIFQKINEIKKTAGVGWFNDHDSLLIEPDFLWDHFSWWMFANRKIWAGTPFGDDVVNLFYTNPPLMVIAGKNVAGFDIPFLRQIKGIFPKFAHRTIDPGMLYFNPVTDLIPPDLKTCKQRAGLNAEVSHEALDDAWDVIQLIRRYYNK